MEGPFTSERDLFVSESTGLFVLYNICWIQLQSKMNNNNKYCHSWLMQRPINKIHSTLLDSRLGKWACSQTVATPRLMEEWQMSLQHLLDLVKGSSAVMVLQNNWIFIFSLRSNRSVHYISSSFSFVAIFPILNKNNKSERRTFFGLYISV